MFAMEKIMINREEKTKSARSTKTKKEKLGYVQQYQGETKHTVPTDLHVCVCMWEWACVCVLV